MAKRALATLTQLSAAEHAFIGSASEGIARVISSLDWRPGDNVVVADKDYASGRFAMLRLAELGVEPRVVKSESWYIDPERLVAACDQRTRLLYVSQVTSLTGQAFDVQDSRVRSSNAGCRCCGCQPRARSHSSGRPAGRLHGFELLQVLVRDAHGHPRLEPRAATGFNPMSIGWASANDSADGQS